VDAHHVLALDARRGARLAQEALGRLFAAIAREQELDRHALAEHLVAGEGDHAHAAEGEELLDAVLVRHEVAHRDRSRLGEPICLLVRLHVNAGAEASRVTSRPNGHKAVEKSVSPGVVLR
jgi:hypothetical protein